MVANFETPFQHSTPSTLLCRAPADPRIKTNKTTNDREEVGQCTEDRLINGLILDLPLRNAYRIVLVSASYDIETG